MYRSGGEDENCKLDQEGQKAEEEDVNSGVLKLLPMQNYCHTFT